MSSSAVRGAVLVAFAALLGLLILRGAADNDQVPILATGAGAVPTVDATLDLTPDPIDLTTPTEVVVTTPARPNSEVAVLVANGTDVSGQALRLTDRLRNQGFNTREPKNAPPQAASVIYYRPGFAAEAMVVREILNVSTPIAPMPEPDPIVGEGIDLVPVDVFVWVGADDLATG